MRHAICLYVAISACLHRGIAAEAGRAEELSARDGLPNVFAKLEAGHEVRIAYLGGSITMADGWRVKTLAWFRERYPAAKVSEINAAVSGTGSGYGACRLREHVLRHDPDLVFVEFRVNGGDGHELESTEGIVRQTWARDPMTDICFVYTISRNMLADLHSGRSTSFGAVMERVADHYRIPSIDLGVEVARREREGTLVFQGDVAAPGKMLFSRDGTHPGEEGHGLYRDIIVRSLQAMGERGFAPHAVPPAIDAECWEKASLVPVTDASLSAGWSAPDASDPVLFGGGARMGAMVPVAMKCCRAGESIVAEFDGTTVGLVDVPGPLEVRVIAWIDGQPPIAIGRRETYRRDQSAGRYFFLPTQGPGRHTVRFEVAGMPEGMCYYVGPLLVAGPER